jgi:heme-degrading monooxygenase HmoA
MYAVIFEVTPFPQGVEAYLDAAAALKEELEKVEGFISVERFQGLNAPQTYLSLSYWESEAAIQAWREHHGHQLAQVRGRNELFRDYRIRVCQVMREYGLAASDDKTRPRQATEENQP